MTPVASGGIGRQLSLPFLLCLLLCFGSASAAVSSTLVSMSAVPHVSLMSSGWEAVVLVNNCTVLECLDIL